MWQQTITGEWVFIVDHLNLIKPISLTQEERERFDKFNEACKVFYKNHNIQITIPRNQYERH